MPIHCSSEDKAVLIALTMLILKAPLHSNLMVVSQQVQGQNMSLSPISWKLGRLFILYRLTTKFNYTMQNFNLYAVAWKPFYSFSSLHELLRGPGEKLPTSKLHKKEDKMTIKHATSNYCPPPTDVQPTTSTGSVHQVNTTIPSRSLWLFLAPSLSFFFHRFSKTTLQMCKVHKGECNSDWPRR